MPAKRTAPATTAQPPMALGPGFGAEQITILLKQALQVARFAYLSVGKLLVLIRDEKVYTALGFADLESYAEQKVHLGRSSVYQYIRLYEFALKHHPEWLTPGPDTFIPELNDAGDLMFIEKELERDDLPEEKKTALSGLKEKALKGESARSDVAPFRRTKSGRDWRKGYLALLRMVRDKGAKYVGMPPEVIDLLNRAIDILSHAATLKLAGVEESKPEPVQRVG